MYLKSLTLKGFKSFADRTSMVFDPGLTVVVGPNGSGKSNVSDAILWVLGEQSARMLRGQSMEDVIFSGSSARQAVGLAEVTLVLDNSDRTLPVDFDEVGITRRMYRSGESEYLINDAPARLRDIQDILHDSGLGRETHSIIGQGRLDSVLSSRPEDRRSLIEEAAGISKHRRRKERSAKKLKAMDDNLTRAKDISREINRQLKPLERQVDRARQAGELQTHLAELTTMLAVDDLRRLQREWNALEARGKEADAEIELARYRVDERSRELEKLQTMLEQRGLFVGDIGEQRRRMQDVLGRVDSDMRLLEEKGRNMVSRLSDMRMTLSSIERQRAEAGQELERTGIELAETQGSVVGLTQEADELSPKLDLARAERSELDRRLEEASARVRDAQREADEHTLAAARLSDQIAGAESEDAIFQSRLAGIAETISNCEEALAERTKRREAAENELEAAKAKVDELEASLASRASELEDAHAADAAARAALADAAAALAALEAVDAAAESASPLLSAVAEKASGIVECRLGDLIQAPAELASLVEDILGDDVTALVVSSADDLSRAVSTALSERSSSGRATMVSLSGIAAQAASKAKGRLVDELTVDKRAESFIDALLGDVVLCDDAESALAAHAKDPSRRYLSRDGAIVFCDGRVRVAGSADGAEPTLERKRRIREFHAAIPGLEKASADAVAKVGRLEAELAEERQRAAEAQGLAARIEGELSSIGTEVGRLSAQRDQAADEQAAVQTRREQAAERAASARENLASEKEAAAAAQRLADDASEEAASIEREREGAARTESEHATKLSELRLSLATASERLRHLESRAAELEARASELEKRREATLASSRSLEVLRLRVDPLHERYEALHEAAAQRAGLLRDRAAVAEADSDSLKKTISDARAAVAEAQAALEAAQTAAADVRVESGRLEVQVQSSINAITADGAYTLEEALELPEPEDRAASEREAMRLSKRLGDIGPVNQVAMDEYTRLKERADYIDEQVADLERARTALIKITAAIDRKMRRAFLATFDAVNRNFQQVFTILFPGGRAYLEMTDPDHPDETGIEIVAQPRGKRLAKMTLLSGGEKSLTALALLFATYRTRTVPFYVFDEVEAALDDSNLNRLLGAIDQLKEDTQLIVISHQRRTMEQADVLYGVSMRSDGVSHVVSQRLDRATGKVVDA